MNATAPANRGDTASVAKSTILEQSNAHRWFHSIRLYSDYVTDGLDQTAEKLSALDSLGLPANMTGKRVLDIGAWDGFFAFEAERRGATEVVALDHVAAEATGFPIAKKALNSSVEWRQRNIYHLDPSDLGTFDVIMCLGVIYHLRHILMGLDRVRGLLKNGGELFVETASIDNHVLQNNGKFGRLADAAPKAHSAPLLQLYPNAELGGDATNVFAPNLAGLEGLLIASEFEVIASQAAPTGFPSRAIAHARAVNNPKIANYRDRDEAVLSSRTYY